MFSQPAADARKESVAERFMASSLELVLPFLAPNSPKDYASVIQLERVSKTVSLVLGRLASSRLICFQPPPPRADATR